MRENVSRVIGGGGERNLPGILLSAERVEGASLAETPTRRRNDDARPTGRKGMRRILLGTRLRNECSAVFVTHAFCSGRSGNAHRSLATKIREFDCFLIARFPRKKSILIRPIVDLLPQVIFIYNCERRKKSLPYVMRV